MITKIQPIQLLWLHATKFSGTAHNMLTLQTRPQGINCNVDTHFKRNTSTAEEKSTYVQHDNKIRLLTIKHVTTLI
jgi:hypothetical protein